MNLIASPTPPKRHCASATAIHKRSRTLYLQVYLAHAFRTQKHVLILGVGAFKRNAAMAALVDKNYTRVIFEALKERPDKKKVRGTRGGIMFTDTLSGGL